jgi:YidC/Oxa1 family membrane protein insertase
MHSIFVIFNKNLIINHDKILAQMDEKRKTPKAKSKWQTRFEQMQQSQKKLQDLKDKTPKKK